MSETIKSRPYSPKACCEKCVFGSGDHAPYCAILWMEQGMEWAFVWQSSRGTPGICTGAAYPEQLHTVMETLEIMSNKEEVALLMASLKQSQTGQTETLEDIRKSLLRAGTIRPPSTLNGTES